MNDLLEAINLYFEGIHKCDVPKLKKVFHKNSSLFDADNGKIFVEFYIQTNINLVIFIRKKWKNLMKEYYLYMKLVQKI